MPSEPLLRFSPFQHTTHVYTVAELAHHIDAVLEADPVLNDVWLRGEIVNVNRFPTGHTYFSLKEDTAQLRCVLFRGSAFNSPVSPANGLAVVAHGSIHYYERQGSCELIADLLFPEGVGLEQMQGERLYRRLEAEGLFEPSRKRPLPPLPQRIGIVTSERGAVIHDLLNVLSRRYPLGEVVVVPSPVQGPGAAAALARAIGRLARWQRGDGGVDVIVLARGGGSDDDLAAFNDERLVRAIFASPVPVVSAVGHETNLTLSDLVADLRASTPSAAAELLAPDVSILRTHLVDLRRRALQAVRLQLDGRQRTLAATSTQARRLAESAVARAKAAISSTSARVQSLSPAATLARGYAIVEHDGHVLHDATATVPGRHLRIQLHRGRLLSTVDRVEPES
jgi:exodeoxyribonuclease VII large subunit